MPLRPGDSALFHWLLHHPWCCGLLMSFSFLVFGGLSLDLARLLWANASFLALHGWQAVQDAALQQLAELLLKVFVAMAAYTGFKLCEHALVDRFAHHTHRPETPHEDPAAPQPEHPNEH